MGAVMADRGVVRVVDFDSGGDGGALRVIETLRDAVEIAEAVPQASVCILMCAADGTVTTGYTTKSRTELIGQLEALKIQVWSEDD